MLPDMLFDVISLHALGWIDGWIDSCVAGRGPLPGPETGLLSNTRK